MVFILSADGRHDDVVGQFKKYASYLQSLRTNFPPGAFALATSDWYFNFHDHRCPHDAWFENFNLIETGSGKRSEIRKLTLNVRLLGAYQDGFIELNYVGILSYRMNMDRVAGGHRDWLFDEFRLSDRGTLIHEIEWAGSSKTGTWAIEASDLEFRWVTK